MKKRLFGMVIGSLAFLLLGACYTPPKVRPAMSQTVITVQRYPAKKAADAKLTMEIYIDDNFSQFTVADDQSVSVPVNDGVHYIYVKVGKFQSETLNFTASQRTVSFLASVERSGALFWKNVKVSLARSVVIDDTGVMTDKAVQQEFVQPQ
jgi:hypothetical protein